MQKMKAALQHTVERVKHDTIPSCGVCAGVPSQAVPPKPPRVLPSGPPEQLQVQRVIQRMQKKDPYKIFAEIPSDEMVRPWTYPTTTPILSLLLQRLHITPWVQEFSAAVRTHNS